MLTFVLITSAASPRTSASTATALEAAPAHGAVAAPGSARGNLVKRPLWRLAAVLDLAGWGLKTAALLVAPLTIVAPAMALGLFVLVVFSLIVLHEKPRVSTLIGIALLAGEVALVALHSPPREVSIAGPLPWLICAGLLLAGALWVFAARAQGILVDVRLMALSCGCAWARNGILSKLMADSIDTSRWALLGLAAEAPSRSARSATSPRQAPSRPARPPPWSRSWAWSTPSCPSRSRRSCSRRNGQPEPAAAPSSPWA